MGTGGCASRAPLGGGTPPLRMSRAHHSPSSALCAMQPGNAEETPMYRAPVSDVAFALKEVAGFGSALAEGRFPGLTGDVVDAVLTEAGRFATEELSPLQRPGDV